MTDKNDYEKAFQDFYAAVANDRHFRFIRVPRDDRQHFWRFCFNEAIQDRESGRREESTGTQLARLFLLGRESASGKPEIQRVERIYFNSVGNTESD